VIVGVHAAIIADKVLIPVRIAFAPFCFGLADFVLDTVVDRHLASAHGCGWSIRR